MDRAYVCRINTRLDGSSDLHGRKCVEGSKIQEISRAPKENFWKFRVLEIVDGDKQKYAFEEDDVCKAFRRALFKDVETGEF